MATRIALALAALSLLVVRTSSAQEQASDPPSRTVELLPSPNRNVEEQRPPKGHLDRSGLTELVFWQSVNGLLEGSLLATALTGGELDRECFEDDGSSDQCADAAARGAGITLVGLAAGVAAPLLVTRGRQVRTADAILINRGTMIGLLHGYIVPFAAGLQPFTDDPDTIEFDKTEARWLAGLTFAGDAIGIGVGTYLAVEYDPQPGLISFMGTVHSNTFLAGMSIGSAFPDDLTQDNMRLISAISLLSADAALGATIYYRDHIDIDRSRVFWIDTGSFIGWLGGGGIGSIIAGDDQRVIAIGGTVGLVAGVVATYFATRDLEDWRGRVDFPGEAHDGATVRLSAPSISIRPVTAPDGTLSRGIFVNPVQGVF